MSLKRIVTATGDLCKFALTPRRETGKTIAANVKLKRKKKSHKLIISYTRNCEKSPRLNKKSKGRKPLLILDLDRTLIDSVTTLGISENVLNAPATFNTTTILYKNIHIYRLAESQQYRYVKFRPGVFEFLVAIAEVYDICLYTQSTREAMEGVLSLLDADIRKTISETVCREECKNRTRKSIKDVEKKFSRSYLDRDYFIVDDDSGNIWGKFSSKCDRFMIISPFVYFTNKAQQKRYANMLVRDPYSVDYNGNGEFGDLDDDLIRIQNALLAEMSPCQQDCSDESLHEPLAISHVEK